MRKKYIDLSELKRIPHSRYGEIIDWKSSEGLELNFQYNEIKDILKIIKYIDGNHIEVEVKGNKHVVNPKAIKNCELGFVLGILNRNYLYNIGDIIHKEKGNLLILGQCYEYRKGGCRNRAYKYKCLTCGNIDIVLEANISKDNKGYGCSCCSGQKVVKGINDMWTTDPELASLLLNKEDGYTVTKASGKKLDWKCPTCGLPILKKVCNQIHRDRTVSCPRCSDGISYPNKFMFNLLLHIGENPEREIFFEWCPNCPFDIVLQDKKIIVEMDGGLGHGNRSYYGERDFDRKEYDIVKDELAIQNGFKVIRIDCSYYGINNRFEHIVSNILNSELVDILGLKERNIDWEFIGKESEKSFVYTACELFNSGMTSTREIAKELNVHYATIIQYLKRGNKYGWCNYDPIKAHRSVCCKKCICIETGESFMSYSEAAQKYKLPKQNLNTMICKISDNCRGIVEDIGSNNILGIKLHFKTA